MEFRAEVQIQASPREVWLALTAFPAYHEWNPLIVDLEGTLQVGSKFKFTFSLPERDERRFTAYLMRCEDGAELRWRGRMGWLGLLELEHFLQVHEMGGQETRLVHGANFSGLLLKF